MKKLLLGIAVIILVFIGLSAGGFLDTSVLSEEEKKIPEVSEEFTREEVSVDYDESFIRFVGSKGDITSHEGVFEEFTVDFELDGSDLTNASVDVEIVTDSIKTKIQGLTDHLKESDFFGVEEYPTATFVSNNIEKKGLGEYKVTGDLTIRDTTKEVVLDGTISNEFAYFEYDLDRTEFGVGPEGSIDAIVPLAIKVMFE